MGQEQPMSQSPSAESVNSPPEHAGIALRVYAVVAALGGIAFGLLGLFIAPAGWCRWLAHALAIVMIPGGVFLLFLGLRGRKEDLQALSGQESVEIAANTAVDRIVGEVIDKLT